MPNPFSFLRLLDCAAQLWTRLERGSGACVPPTPSF